MYWLLLFLGIIGFLAYKRVTLMVWTITFFVFLICVSRFSAVNIIWLTLFWLLFLSAAVMLNVTFLRQNFITKFILNRFRQALPKVSATEKAALAAGTVGWEGEFFTGKPDWQKLMTVPVPYLSAEEQAFLDGPVAEVCALINDWDITHNRFDLSPEVWNFLKGHGFFGMIIPKKYGGKEFSALAHAEVLAKLAGCSISVFSTVSVPNSLGPAELLLQYGTEEQKNYYLPRLASGEEIPCFALTNPEAGSDAGAIPDYGVVCEGEFEGKKVIGIRLNWNKRYITLAPVATLLGLAFKLYDPDHLLGKQEKIGITCALIPRTVKGIVIGRRHFPLNCAFPNGPTQGKNVFIPLDWIIGGPRMAGQGWRMLMECLAAGRAISLPSGVTGGAKKTLSATTAYSVIRKQFGLPIGHFEGIEEVLAKMIGLTYLMDATRIMTVAAIDRGEQPAVASAISKYSVTEAARKAINFAMDVHGGKGICLGPHNYLGRAYQETPISITVEGANILTRSLIIFGQGAMRCHPYILTEMQAAQNPNEAAGLDSFDKALFSHMGMIFSNIVRAFLLGISNGRLAGVPQRATKHYFQMATRFSAAFSLAADMSMLCLGGSLKRREKLSGRLADILSNLYIISAILRRFEDQGAPNTDLPVVSWAAQSVLFETQQHLSDLLNNFPNKFIAGFLRVIIFPLGLRLKPPNDALGHKVVRLFLTPTATRARLVKGAYVTPDKNNMVGMMEEVMQQVLACEEIEKRMHKMLRQENISIISNDYNEKVQAAVQAKIITQGEAQQLLTMDQARKKIIAVDDFAFEELSRL
jgi:acyl-CoA dehydrogenase